LFNFVECSLAVRSAQNLCHKQVGFGKAQDSVGDASFQFIRAVPVRKRQRQINRSEGIIHE